MLVEGAGKAGKGVSEYVRVKLFGVKSPGNLQVGVGQGRVCELCGSVVGDWCRNAIGKVLCQECAVKVL